ncbi:hypothetical protein SELMODRAFT_127411 [Selaginella moellendorffii]|uniref:Uncharacterized protein MAX4-2 n=1 Tax=Selaginella moellendorffii TaxID=88036 RepID=D8SXI9_SELML|nr:carotenoid cleavage dioxygenase 8 homolog B, chloroplastic [Selaginella moellendorffii]EFJ10893.1 hypothetical protein SELMODRAFT_127411 [Selaginella moellendorffii]|eukprot:XP_002988101.1 carotenoid cleavage dioxygenase 8 homolog B, chloroplastic [Selaginella moellendorffii]
MESLAVSSQATRVHNGLLLHSESKLKKSHAAGFPRSGPLLHGRSWNQSTRIKSIEVRSILTREPAKQAGESCQHEELKPAWLNDKYAGLATWNSIRRESWEGELPVIQGQIPLWLKGTYLRNGPGRFEMGEHRFGHLFDGYSCLLRLYFENGKLHVKHAQLQSDAYKSARKNQQACFREFSVVPKHENIWSLLEDVVGMAMGTTLTDNANTGVICLGDGRVVCITETVKSSTQIDPWTLDTIGRFTYDDNHKGLLQSGHPYVTDKEFITALPDLIKPGYDIVRMEPGTNTRKHLGRVNCKGPAPGWIHSFALTENYIVIPEMALRYSTKNLLKAEPCPYYKFEYMPEHGSYLHVMDRKSGKVVNVVEVPNFLMFHFINAYEETGEDGKPRIVADCCEHLSNPIILRRMELAELRSKGKEMPYARLGRFKIPISGGGKGTLENAVPPQVHGHGLDMNTMNPHYYSRDYRYVYANGAHRPCHFPNSLVKIDIKGQSAKEWYEHGSIPTEPMFVPRPGATEEDDGVAISIVNDDKGDGYVLLLDGKSFEEVARAPLPYGLPYGIHGAWLDQR